MFHNPIGAFRRKADYNYEMDEIYTGDHNRSSRPS